MYAKTGGAAVALALALVGGARPTNAQVPARSLTAFRATASITIDGRLDDAAWAATEPVTEMVQKLPAYGEPPRFPAEIRVAFDGDALYVAARLWDAPGATRAVVTRRDQTRDAERFIVSFDPYRSGRLAYSFAVTVAGVRADWIHTDDDERARDMSWNPVWSAATQVLPDGWSCEMRLPWTQLRYPEHSDLPWGVNFNRYIPDRNEDSFWIAVPRERTAWASYMGELRGLSGLPRRVGLELLPYAATSLEFREDDGDLDPGGNLGLDAKLGLGAGLSLDVAVNPDFGQVEADPAIVNLTAFEVSLPERRPFFVAGNEIFAAAPRIYFYSRRIGADPDRLLGAAKLSGRPGGGTTVGALAAITHDRTTSGDATGWSAARVERELGASRVGATVAAVGRSIDDEVAAVTPRASAVGGVDGVYRWDDGAWELRGLAGASGLWGEPTAVERVQRSSTHYFQRPDATHVEVDPARTSLTGWHGGGHLGRRAGSVQGQVGVNVESPGFDTNGTGILMNADELSVNAVGGWYDTTPSARWLSWRLELKSSSGWTFGGDRRAGFGELEMSGVTRGAIELEGGIGAGPPAVSDSLTRGGPLVATPANVYGFASVSSRSSSVATWALSLNGNRDDAGTTSLSADASVSLRPHERLRVELAPRVSVDHNRLTYVTTAAGGPVETFGERYVFATLDQRELALVTRLELTLGPDLAIDLYLEPFVSTGAYSALSELQTAGRRDLRPYDDVVRRGTTVDVNDGAGFSFDEPDFTARSLRSTAVLRWEPRPGSTLYAVWQQARGDDELRARALGSSLLDAATAPGSHTFAVKLAWWFAR